MQGGGTRLAAGKAPRAPQRCPIRSAPLCDGRLTPGATPHGPTGQGEERRHHGGALAVVTANSWALGPELDAQTCLWSHRYRSSTVLWRV